MHLPLRVVPILEVGQVDLLEETLVQCHTAKVMPILVHHGGFKIKLSRNLIFLKNANFYYIRIFRPQKAPKIPKFAHCASFDFFACEQKS